MRHWVQQWAVRMVVVCCLAHSTALQMARGKEQRWDSHWEWLMVWTLVPLLVQHWGLQLALPMVLQTELQKVWHSAWLWVAAWDQSQRRSAERLTVPKL